MNPGGDAAEQVVRMSLEGVEVAAKITGVGAKNIAILLAAVLKEEQKTRGKSRMTSMLKSGKELKVYSIRQKDLATFAKEAKKYGVLYCVLKDKNSKDENAVVDIMARADDASKIQRVTERFRLTAVDRASVISNIEKERGAASKQPANDEKVENPLQARMGKEPLSERSLNQENQLSGKTGMTDKKSVREKLEGYKSETQRKKTLEKTLPSKVKAPKEKGR